MIHVLDLESRNTQNNLQDASIERFDGTQSNELMKRDRIIVALGEL